MLLHMPREKLASCRFPLRNLWLGPGMRRYLQRAWRFRPYDKNCNMAEAAALVVMHHAYGEKASKLGLHTKLKRSHVTASHEANAAPVDRSPSKSRKWPVLDTLTRG